MTYPNNEIDLGLGWSASQELEGPCNIHWSNLVQVVSLVLVLLLEVFEDSVEFFLLDGLDLNGLEDLSWTSLQFLHLVCLFLDFFIIY